MLIKGIAKRLGIKWSLADKWQHMAEQALECGEDGCVMPTWSASPAAARQLAQQAAEGAASAAGRPRFGQVVSAYGSSSKLAARWAAGKVGSVVPPPIKRAAIRVAARVAAGRD